MSDLSLYQMREVIRDGAREHGGMKALSTKIGVSYAFIHNVLSGKKPPGGKVLAYFGYEAVQHATTYRRKQEKTS